MHLKGYETYILIGEIKWYYYALKFSLLYSNLEGLVISGSFDFFL